MIILGNSPHPHSRTQAFSLVELSIVLVILGLLIGGILSGQALIRAAELRAIPTEVGRFNAAVMSFRDKYFQLPGDMTNASSFWNLAATCPGDFTTPATTPLTCNGDGNGQINWAEAWRAWQHLANAGLIEGSYTGVQGAASDPYFGVAGSNMPASKAARAGYVYVWIGTYTSDTAPYFKGNYGNTLHWGNDNGVDEGTLIKPEEAWNIDSKMDDGIPSTGNLRSFTNPQRGCATTGVASTAKYDLASSNTTCNLLFITGF
jgi:prepilin-type N-terminal cleavage/methylation domain-containing protein